MHTFIWEIFDKERTKIENNPKNIVQGNVEPRITQIKLMVLEAVTKFTHYLVDEFTVNDNF